MELEKHDRNIEKFYTAGSKIQKISFDTQELGEEYSRFLSFGYWEDKRIEYKEATKQLLQFFIENSGITNTKRILNIACGYGAESFAFYNSFKPEELIGVDITKVHIDYSNWKAEMLNLSDKIKFIYANAVNLIFPDNSFSHILGIEGPAHFDTREAFFHSANRVLEPGGELLLTDILIGDNYDGKKFFQKLILKIAAKGWVTPRANQVKEDQYRKQLEKAGFSVIFLQKIGAKVFPGYSRHFNREILKESIRTMGWLKGTGIGCIAKLLGYLYKKGIIDYIYVKARKL